MTGDIRDDWRIQAIERKADQAVARLYEIDTLRSTVTGLESTIREIRTDIARLCSEFECYKEEVREIIGE